MNKLDNKAYDSTRTASKYIHVTTIQFEMMHVMETSLNICK